MSITVTVDFEVTNRCNADCHFCPRDMTPHEGLMSWETFEAGLQRTIEMRDLVKLEFDEPVNVSLCGLGEPLLNKHLPEMIRAVKDAGFVCKLSSNGALLNEKRRAAILDAGLDEININIGDIGEAYEEVYNLPYERTQQRILDFHREAGDDCDVNIVLVDYKADRDHLKTMVRHWQALGINSFLFFDVMNRGGALFVDTMEFESYPELAAATDALTVDGEVAFCPAPFFFLFIGYDAKYYLCCSDWTKKAPFGTVHDTSFLAIAEEKLAYVANRTEVCQACNWDPVNRLTAQMRDEKVGISDAAATAKLTEELLGASAGVRTMMTHFAPHIAVLPASEKRSAKLIPVRAT
jgi:MoaA/NifB/PqqE/SkfB family radical SAM enzyme